MPSAGALVLAGVGTLTGPIEVVYDDGKSLGWGVLRKWGSVLGATMMSGGSGYVPLHSTFSPRMVIATVSSAAPAESRVTVRT